MEFSVEVKFEPFIDIDDVLSGVAVEGAEIIESKIKGLMQEPKSGKPYKHRDGGVRPASSEGEAPGIDSTELVNSFEIVALSAMEAEINSDVEHGAILQEKRNRPFTEPAIEQAMPEIVDLIEERIEQGWQ